MIGFGIANDIPKGDGIKGDANSPDGLLLNCVFDMDRLKGDSLSKAIAHMGAHIADLRGKTPNVSPRMAEYQAWQITILSAVATRQKTLTAPGGYVVWNAAWPEAERGKRADDALANFLQNWAALGI